MVDTPLLKKIKAIQANDLKNWKGLPVEYISRPGNYFQLCNMLFCFPGLLLNAQLSRAKPTKTADYLKVEDERFRVFLEGLIRYREWEEERMNTVYQVQQ